MLPLYGIIDQRDSAILRFFGGTSCEAFGADLDALLATPKIAAVAIDVSSPGGSVFGVAELATRVYNARSWGKPIIAVVNSLCASAAYWIASQADQIYITPGGLGGAIGVYTVHLDQSRALDKAGLAYTFVSAGKYKVDGNSTEPASDSFLKHEKQTVDSYFDSFVRHVSRGRGASTQAVRNGFGEGRMLTAKNAVAAGLCDKIGTLADAIKAAAQPGHKPVNRAAQQHAERERWLAQAERDAKSYNRRAVAERRAELARMEREGREIDVKLASRTPAEKPKCCPPLHRCVFGTAAPFHSRSKNGGTFAPGAFKATLADGHDIFATIDHDGQQAFASTSDGTLKLWEGPNGLQYAATPWGNASGKAAVRGVKNGDLCGASVQHFTRSKNSNGQISTAELVEISLTANPSHNHTGATVINI
ncbi:MAG: S49 family peptidase [Planctomycetes bacterium]|nr:S49 family peptidase [Planctomycetota bacterium]